MLKQVTQIGNFTKSIKNQPCDVMKMREMRGEVGKKTSKRDEKSIISMTLHNCF